MKIKFPGIKQIARPPSISFTKDNVHLTDRAARLHFKSVYKASYETFFTKEDDYLTEDEGTTPIELDPEQEVEISVKKKKRSRQESEGSSDEEGRQEGPSKHSVHSEQFKRIIDRVEDLQRKVDRRWSLDLIISAGTKEDLDKIENNLNKRKKRAASLASKMGSSENINMD